MPTKKTPKRKRAKESDPVLLYNMEVVPYNMPIFWSFAPSAELFLEELERTLPFLKGQSRPIAPGTLGHCEIFLHEDDYYPVVWVADYKKPWVIAHEVMHLTHWLLDLKGMRWTDDSEEAYCYLAEFIMMMMLTNRRPDRYPKSPKTSKNSNNKK